MIHIFYRHYNISGTDNKSRPNWFSFENCYKNLLHSLRNNSIQEYSINIIMDDTTDDNNWIYNQHYNYLYKINAKSDKNSFFETVKIAYNDPKIKDSDLIYFLENDYLHIDNWLDKVNNLFNTYSNLNYISLYDHYDKYTLSMYSNLVSQIIVTNSHHWRTTPSTCGSFIINKKILIEDFNILSTMEGDHNKFLFLSETKNRYVLTPIPGLSTHCMQNLLSPTINWEQINNTSYE